MEWGIRTLDDGELDRLWQKAIRLRLWNTAHAINRELNRRILSREQAA